MNKVVVGAFALALVSCTQTTTSTRETRDTGSQLQTGAAETIDAAAAMTPGEGVSRLFETKAAASQPFADSAPGTYYMALELRSPAGASGPVGCFDSNFWSWLRRNVWRTSGSVAITAEVRPPNSAGASITVPVFQSVVDETVSPIRCTSVMPDRWPITPLYRADGPFLVTATVVEARTGQVQLDRIKTLTSGLATFAGISGDLATKVADPAFTAAIGELKRTVDENWSVRSDSTYPFSLSPLKVAGQSPLDEAHFATPQLVLSATGVQVSSTATPTVTISPIYRQSLFGEGPGKYRAPSQILGTRISTNATLETVLLAGLPGFTIDNALALTTADQMDGFCRQMRVRFSEFLTPDDALAAAFSVLWIRTNYRKSPELRKAECFSATETARLKELSTEFAFPDLAREVPIDRSRVVRQRLEPLTSALLSGETTSLRRLLADPATFQLTTNDRAQAMLGLENSEVDTLVGEQAWSALSTPGTIYISCYRALPDQNLRIIPALARNVSTGVTTPLAVEFSGDETVDDAKIVSIAFYSVGQMRTLFRWSPEDCG